MSNEKKSKSKVIMFSVAAVLIVAVVIVAVVFAVINNNREKQASAIMQLDTNPSIQLVLNKKDKVIGEVALNADGEKLLANVSFMGMKAEVAAEKFAQTSAEMDKINDSESSKPNEGKSTTIQITISAEVPDDYKELANKAKNAVNEYFGENGIFAGAVVEVSNDIESALTNMGANAKDFVNKSTTELLEYAKTTADDLKEVAIEKRDSLTTKFNSLYDTVLKSVDEALENAKLALDNASGLSEEVRSQLQKAYDNALSEYNKMKAEFDKQYKAFIKSVQEESETILEQIKTEAKSAYEQTLEAYNAHVNDFKQLTEELKNQRQEEIKAFQEQLASNV